MAILTTKTWRAIKDADWPRAVTLGRAAVEAESASVDAVRALAIALWAHGETEGAIGVLARLMPSDPPDPLFWSDLGALKFRAAKYLEAAECYQRALTRDPRFLSALHGRGEALVRVHRYMDARPLFEECVRREPSRRLYLESLARCLVATDDLEKAEQVIDECLAREPDSAVNLLLKAAVASKQTRHQHALELVQAAVAVCPESFEAQANLALARWNAGDSAGAFAAQDRALQIPPTDEDLHASLLWLALHDPARTGNSIRDLYCASARFWAGSEPIATSFADRKEPERGLRIGYLSGEFVMNPAFCFLACWLQHQNREQFTSYFYMSRALCSEHTARYQEIADHWREVWMLEDQQLTDLIREDEIDVLVDLSGHFAEHRLSVFARRAAPVQVAFPHFPATTGVDQMDYLLSDEWTTPPGSESEYVEKVYRLPSGYISFQLKVEPPAVSPLPAHGAGFVTFGLFQRPGKYHDHSWDAVAEILRRVPSAKLLFHFESAELDTPGSTAQCALLEKLGCRGVSTDRVLFRGSRPLEEHLQVVGEADIALDSFPYNGQTTTCDCLWMGVPVVNLRGATHAARVGQGLLQRVGLEHLSSDSIEGYIRTAVDLGTDVDALAKLRSELRSRAVLSLGDGARLSKEIEEAYRWMWRRWCSS